MSKREQFYQALPEEFTREQAMKIAKQFDYSYSSASSLPAKFVYEDRLERVDTGIYKNIHSHKPI